MKKIFTLIIVLSLTILALYWFKDSGKLSREEILTAEALNSLKGKIYSAPDIESSPFKYFFIDEDGNLYGIEPEKTEEISNIEVITKIEEFKNSNNEVEVKGKIEKEVEDYGEKRIIVKEIEKIVEIPPSNSNSKSSILESITCQSQGGKIETKQVCVLPNGKECNLGDLIKGRCY